MKNKQMKQFSKLVETDNASQVAKELYDLANNFSNSLTDFEILLGIMEEKLYDRGYCEGYRDGYSDCSYDTSVSENH